MKDGFLSTIASILRGDWIDTMYQNKIQNRLFTKKKNKLMVSIWWSRTGVIQYSWWDLVSQLQRTYTSTNWMRWCVSLHLNYQDWSIETDQVICKTMRSYMLHKERCSNYNNWTCKYSVVHRIPQTLHQLWLLHFSDIRQLFAKKTL